MADEEFVIQRSCTPPRLVWRIQTLLNVTNGHVSVLPIFTSSRAKVAKPVPTGVPSSHFMRNHYTGTGYAMSINRMDSNQRMSQIVVHGNTVYLAGQVASGDTVADQAGNILSQIDGLLAKAGTDKSKILTCTIWLCSMDDFAEMNAVWDAWIDPANPPARACVESPRLATPEFRVEMMVVATL